MSRIDKEAVRKRIDGLAYFRRSFPSARFNGDSIALIKCIFHEDKNPSLALYATPGDPHYFCHGCQAKGDIFELRQKLDGIDFGESLRRFAAEVGAEPPRGKTPPREKTPPPPRQELEKIASDAEAGMGGKTLHGICKAWGIGEETVRRFRLGWTGDVLVIPVIQAGEVASVCYRKVSVEDGQRVKKVWRSKGAKAAVYNSDDLLARPDAPVLIVEGERDCIVASERFPEHVVTSPTGGAKSLTKKLCVKLAGRDVTLWFDNDEPGDQGAAKGARFLSGVAESVAVVSWQGDGARAALAQLPEDKRGGADVSEFVAAKLSDADLRGIVAEAEPYEPPAEKQTATAPAWQEIDADEVIDAQGSFVVGRDVAFFVVPAEGRTANGQRERRPVLIADRAEYVATNGREVEVRGEQFNLGKPLYGKRRWSREHVQHFLDGERSPPEEAFSGLLKGLRDYLEFPSPEAAIVVATWSFTTYAFPLFPAFPYLHFIGPAGSGKTRALEYLQATAQDPEMVASITGPCLFRSIKHRGPTLLEDEAERAVGKSEHWAELQRVLNSGYRRTGQTMRLRETGNKGEYAAERFPTYCPKAFASVREPKGPLADRCIKFVMLRPRPDSAASQRTLDPDSARWVPVRAACYGSILSGWRELRDIYATEPTVRQFPARHGELWAPLLTFGVWLERHGVNPLVEPLTAFAKKAIGMGDGEIDPRDGMILETVYGMARTGMGKASASDVVRAIRDRDDEEERSLLDSWRNPAQGVGYILKRFGIPRTDEHRHKYCLDAGDIADRALRYGLTLGDTPQDPGKPCKPCGTPDPWPNPASRTLEQPRNPCTDAESANGGPLGPAKAPETPVGGANTREEGE